MVGGWVESRPFRFPFFSWRVKDRYCDVPSLGMEESELQEPQSRAHNRIQEMEGCSAVLGLALGILFSKIL